MMMQWFRSGNPWIWLTAAAVSTSMIIVIGLVSLLAVNGLAYFWPKTLYQFQYTKNNATQQIIGEFRREEEIDISKLDNVNVTSTEQLIKRTLVKVGNREILGSDFIWVENHNITDLDTPKDLLTVERREWGNVYGYLQSISEGEKVHKENLHDIADKLLQRTSDIYDNIHYIEKNSIGSINYSLERLRLDQRRLELKNQFTPEDKKRIDEQKRQLQQDYQKLQADLAQLYKDVNRDKVTVGISGNKSVTIPMSKIVRFYRPNQLGMFSKTVLFFSRIWEFVTDEPREANTEGGIFPAIFGTVMMVIIMSIFVTPFGVIAAVYLHEYARDGAVTRIIRIAVNNLAGVPSIVYGVFGLGFFVYFLGGNLDQLFYPEALPAPTFGTPGILWASLTLAILTVPVVIVATEEGLSRIPRNIREGSLALGATKAETLWRTILPMASPAMMTGLILAIARAAGEVAPLMLVGTVKLAPSLPLDGNFPFIHLERKFMHLGFHIYDVGFQSPNVESAQPLVYATSLLLVLVIILLNLSAIWIRNHLREMYRGLEN